MRFRLARLMALAAALLVAYAAPSAAQVAEGRIDVTVTDSTGAVLPGVAVDIAGPQSRTAVTDAIGEAHFLNLAPGTYSVTAKIQGFSDYVNNSVPVGVGAAVPLKVSMAIAGVSTQVQVSAETPTLDVKKTTTTTHVTVEELQNVPSARDPWVVMQTVPGIIVDRVNVGGSESGQQSAYMAKGASGSDNTWNMDGVAITDMAATGSTPTYYSFDLFQEMQVTTGGADVKSATPGVQLNMVLKSGSNTPHGSADYYFENEKLQSTNIPSDLVARLGGGTGKGNRMHQYKDWGGEIGGPIIKDRLWGWGFEGKTHVDLLTLIGSHDKTDLHNSSLKFTGQATPDLRANFTWFRGNKIKIGRGASATRPPETTYDQSGPTNLYKGEGNFVFGNDLFLSAKYGHVKGGFQLVSEGGPNANWWIGDDGVYHGGVDTYKTKRPQDNFSLDANSFHGKHELKFGFGYRKAQVDSTDAYPGSGIITIHIGYPDMEALIKRDYALKTDGVYWDAYGGDTITLNRATINLGVRWDRQLGSLGAGSVPANKTFPNILPGVSTSPVKNAIVWNSFTPRIGVTYAADENRKTLLRGTYAMFASQLGSAAASTISTIQYTGIYYYAVDLNGNHVADANEILFNLGNAGYYGFDPSNPGKLETNNKIGKYTTPVTHEVTAGIDHELMTNFGLSATFTYRYMNHFDWSPLIGVNGTNYHQTGTLTGSIDPIGSFSVPFYAIDPAVVPPGAGHSYEERPGYHQRYLGFEASATKRLSNHWMARFGFSTNDHREYFDGLQAVQDPTPSRDNPNKDGGLVITRTGGSGKSNIFLVLPKYQFIANGLYQGPWGLNFGANWSLRQGYAEPFYRSSVATGDVLGRKIVLVVDDVGKFRLPYVSSLDVRVEKAFRIQRTTLALDLDVFNLGNAATVLGRTYDVRLTGATGFNQVLEIMNPRIARVGVRFNF